jgi:type VI secretion system protein ImpH
VAPQRLVRYAGLLAGRTRSPAGLEALLADYFGIKRVRVSPFLPKNVRLQSGDRNRLGVRGRNNRLGRDLVLGKWVRDAAGFFRLSLGPLSLRNFQKLQPGRQAFNELVFLVNFFTRRQLEFELELILDRDQVKPFVLSAKWNLNPLGRYSWLGEPQSRTVSARLEPNET